MLPKAISAWRFADGHPVVDVAPMVRRNVDRVDAARLDGVDELEHALDLRPAVELQEKVAARTDERQRLERLAATDRQRVTRRGGRIPREDGCEDAEDELAYVAH